MHSDKPRTAPAAQSTESASVSRVNAFYTLGHYKDFRLLWIGNVVSMGAQWLQVLSIGWLVLKLTEGNALLTGMSVGMRTLPVLVIGPWAGALADRLDRRQLVMATEGVMAAAAVVFACLVVASDLDAASVSGPLRWWHPFVYMVISGIAHAITQPVRQAMVPNTVPRHALAGALALNGMAPPTARILGPALGGLLIATLGFKWNFFLEALASVSIVVLLFFMQLSYREEDTRRHASLFSSMREGVRYVVRERSILQLMVMVLIPNFVFQPLVFVLPVFTSAVLHRGADAGGVLAAAVGAGAVTAATLIATGGLRVRKGRAACFGLVGGCIFVLLFARSDWYLVSIVTLAGLGFCQNLFRVSSNILLQGIVPDALRGRVMSLYMLDTGLTPLATLLISLLIHVWNPSDAFTVIAGVSLSLAMLQVLAFRRVRQLD
jgi:MFS family permease